MKDKSKVHQMRLSFLLVSLQESEIRRLTLRKIIKLFNIGLVMSLLWLQFSDAVRSFKVYLRTHCNLHNEKLVLSGSLFFVLFNGCPHFAWLKTEERKKGFNAVSLQDGTQKCPHYLTDVTKNKCPEEPHLSLWLPFTLKIKMLLDDIEEPFCPNGSMKNL